MQRVQSDLDGDARLGAQVTGAPTSAPLEDPMHAAVYLARAELGDDELQPRSNWFEAETQRAWAWLAWRSGDDDLGVEP